MATYKRAGLLDPSSTSIPLLYLSIALKTISFIIHFLPFYLSVFLPLGQSPFRKSNGDKLTKRNLRTTLKMMERQMLTILKNDDYIYVL